jgi:hypothetical protein
VSLPWIKVAADLRENEKSVRLAAMLNDRRAWSYVVGLWMWCAEQQGDGRVAGPLDEAKGMIEFGASWAGPAGQLADALLRCGFIEPSEEGGLEVHDWMEWQAAHASKRAKERERKAKQRARLKGAEQPLAICPVGRPAGQVGQNPQRVESREKKLTTTRIAPRAGANGPKDPRKEEKRSVFERVFLELRRDAYYWQGAKDQQAVNRLIAVPIDEWEARARRGLTSREYATRISSVAQLGMKWNDLGGTAPTVGPAVKRAVGSVGDFTKKEANEF